MGWTTVELTYVVMGSLRYRTKRYDQRPSLKQAHSGEPCEEIRHRLLMRNDDETRSQVVEFAGHPKERARGRSSSPMAPQ